VLAAPATAAVVATRTEVRQMRNVLKIIIAVSAGTLSSLLVSQATSSAQSLRGSPPDGEGVVKTVLPSKMANAGRLVRCDFSFDADAAGATLNREIDLDEGSYMATIRMGTPDCWETNALQYGEGMTASVRISDSEGKEVISISGPLATKFTAAVAGKNDPLFYWSEKEPSIVASKSGRYRLEITIVYSRDQPCRPQGIISFNIQSRAVAVVQP